MDTLNNNKVDILIIDDDPDILKACETMLKMRLYTVDTARNGYDAKNRLEEKSYKVVLTDLKMPNLSGLDLLKDIKHKTPATDVIVFTAHGTIHEAVEAMKLGAYDFITKPIDINQVGTIIKRCLEKHSLIAEIGGLKQIINLYEVSKALVTVKDMNELLSLIVATALETVHGEAGSLLLYNAQDKTLEVKAAAGTHKEQLINKRMAIGERVAGFVAEHKEGVIIHGSVDRDPRFKDIIPYESISSGMSIPILSKTHVLGILNVSRIIEDKPFTDDDMKLLSILASQTAIALENSTLFEDVKKQKEMVEHMFESMRDGAFLLDNELNVILANPAALALFNQGKESLTKQSIIQITKDFKISMPWGDLQKSTKPIETFELTRQVDKSLFLEVRAMKLPRSHAGWLIIMRDVTTARQEAIVKHGFLSVISRKIRTPLLHIINKIAGLIEINPTDTILSVLLEIENQSTIISEMVDKLIQFSLLETDQYSITPRPAHIKQVINRSIHMLASLIEISNTVINIEPSLDKLPRAWIDETKIQEIFEYMIENAIKFNDKKKTIITISGALRDERTILIEIADNGPGIPDTMLSNIFQQFFQSDEISKSNGVGLSLAMAKKIIESHDGTIGVHSTPQTGSTFSITLPVA